MAQGSLPGRTWKASSRDYGLDFRSTRCPAIRISPSVRPSFRVPPPRYRIALTVTGLIATDDGVRLWIESGGMGVEMMLLHGGPGLWDYLAPLAVSLEDACSIARYDQRGGGRSDH